MSDTAIWADYTPISERTDTSQSAVEPKKSNGLDKNAFLMLLITQMKYQDPLSPMDDKEFVAQMAQFSSLEQMQNLNTTMSISQSYSLIGKTVVGTSFSDITGQYTDFGGKVEFVTIKNGEPYITVNGAEYKASDVTDIFENFTETNALNAITNSQNVMLVGKTIQAITVENGVATDFVEGKVDYIKFVSGTPILVVGTKEVFPSEIISISENDLLTNKQISVEIVKDDGTTEIVSGAVEGVSIIDNKAYLLVEGHQVEIEKIDAVIEALKYVNKPIKSLNLSGIADGVLIKDKVPYLTIGDEMVKLSEIVR